jgi:hypothetical protein
MAAPARRDHVRYLLRAHDLRLETGQEQGRAPDRLRVAPGEARSRVSLDHPGAARLHPRRVRRCRSGIPLDGDASRTIPTCSTCAHRARMPTATWVSRIVGRDYRELVAAVHAEDKQAEQSRYLGKVANLCIAEGTTILTDRGPCNIEHVRIDDRVWDGQQFVVHAGVQFSGVFPVISYMGVTATLEHKVLLENGRWEEIEAAARHGWTIQSALGARWSDRARSAVRIVGGLVRRTVHSLRSALRARTLSMRHHQRRQSTLHGDGSLSRVLELRSDATTLPETVKLIVDTLDKKLLQKRVNAMRQRCQNPKDQSFRNYGASRDRVSVCDRSRRGWTTSCPRCRQSLIVKFRHRPNQQRWSLRAWKLALGYARGEPCQSREVRTYDIVNCGPNTRFAANGLIVHNSLSYRTYPKTFRRVARVDYNIPLELPEAQRIHRTYQQTYTEVPKYWDRAIQLSQAAGLRRDACGPPSAGHRRLGRQVRLEAWSRPRSTIRSRALVATKSILRCKLMRDLMIPERCYFAWDLHDGLYWWVPDAIVDRMVVRR